VFLVNVALLILQNGFVQKKKAGEKKRKQKKGIKKKKRKHKKGRK
jgi:hypothetical protein